MKKTNKSRVSSNSKILVGKPVITGTRISVEFILELLSSGWTYDQIIKDYKIKKEDILAAIDYARETVSNIKTIPLSSLK